MRGHPSIGNSAMTGDSTMEGDSANSRDTAVKRPLVPFDELRPLQGKAFRMDGRSIALFRLTDGTVRAVENRCPHKAGPLSEGIVCDHHVYCPLHDWKIDLASGRVQPPDEGCVETYRTEIDNGTVYVWIPLRPDHPSP